MARFSVFDFEKKGRVSIWVAIVPWTQLPKEYFEEHYGREDNEAFTQFSEDFGFGFFDHDFVDTNGSKETKLLEELLGECSFSSSYLGEAVAESNKRGLTKTSFVFLLYDIEYQPETTKVSRSSYMEFLGSFRFDPKATSVRASR
jgi:Immunity protein 22